MGCTSVLLNAHLETVLISLLSGRSLIVLFFSLIRSVRESTLKYLYIQMELCSTKSLRLWINQNNENQTQERKEESLSIFRQIVSGVEYIHSRKFIHRDLKVRRMPPKPCGRWHQS